MSPQARTNRWCRHRRRHLESRPAVLGYRRDNGDGQPPYLHPPYRSTLLRAPKQALPRLPHTITELTGPLLGAGRVREHDNDLTRQHAGEPLGERIVVFGQVLDGDARPVPHTLIEVWQANAAGRYAHDHDRHPAPLDPNFTGVGRCLTDEQGRYQFVTIKPGAYPWQNHHNAWRPAHLHFSLFGAAFATRLITQMYFPGDPLFGQDPIFNSVRDERARQRLLARFRPGPHGSRVGSRVPLRPRAARARGDPDGGCPRWLTPRRRCR